MTDQFAGKIYRIRFPFTESDGFKLRPALALCEPDEYGDIRWAFITTREIHSKVSLPLGDEMFEDQPLPRPSSLIPDKTFTIHRDRIDRYYAQLTNTAFSQILKSGLLANTREYSKLAHQNNRPGGDPLRPQYPPGQPIPYAGRVFTEDEVEAAVSSTLDFWLTLGPEGEAMEKELAGFMGVKHCLLVNSGSSANLVAISALTTHKLPEHKRIRPGDEVITVAAGFPTTVAPIIQIGAVPVFIDANPLTGNAECSQLEAAYSPGKTKAVMMAHALGNPFDLATTLAFCKKYDLWLIEDNCDALGCTYTLPLELAKQLGLDHLIKIAEKGEHPIIRIHSEENVKLGKLNRAERDRLEQSDSPAGGRPEGRIKAEIEEKEPLADASSFQISAFNFQLFLTAPTGAFGDISTQSFYPPHHLTMGEGGAVNIIRKPALKTYAESFRDWGRDCWCASGKDDTCNKRFQWQLGELPAGHDHKYIYSHLGYNLKPLDIQAAIGRVQLKRLPDFIDARKRNWEHLRRGLHGLEKFIDFALPTHATAWLAPGEEKLKAEIGKQAEENEESRKLEEEKLKVEIGKLKSEIVEEEPSAKVSGFQLSTFPISQFSWDDTQCRSDCSWFGFMMTIREDAPFTRTDLARHLDEHKIGNRMLFGGNLVRQPAFVQLKRDNPQSFRVAEEENLESRKLNRAERDRLEQSDSPAGGRPEGRIKAEIEEPETSAEPSPFQLSDFSFQLSQEPSAFQLSAFSSQLSSSLPGADRIMNHTLFIGTYPGLTKEQIAYMVNVIRDFVAGKVEVLKAENLKR